MRKECKEANTKRFVIKEPQDGYDYIKHKLMFEKQEKVILLCLNSRLEIIQEKLIIYRKWRRFYC
ncbi:JAB domain-containing protein [Faecalibacillus intestinalis]|uniref:JAB domain-containing protein n=1 Tax=Faecalibacillus intestinalis TaxID=1982626 RepID=UPI0035219D3F